ncbi:MAG: DNA-binding protein [Bacteroidetes bacterium CG_4_9_14_3_um_filter_41_19]|nr:MAG: DNA-binding protein [Bacteroidetes bacterium CG_4_9_14_3_um_filter_41_19]
MSGTSGTCILLLTLLNLIEMSIKVKAMARKNPQDLTAAPKFYAQVVSQGEVTLDQIAAYIAQMSTVSKTDVYAVLMGLTEVIPQQLEDGRIVRLGNLGSFSVSLSSLPSDTIEAVTAANVEQLKLSFRPSQELKRKVEAFPVSKIS